MRSGHRIEGSNSSGLRACVRPGLSAIRAIPGDDRMREASSSGSPCRPRVASRVAPASQPGKRTMKLQVKKALPRLAEAAASDELG